MSSPGVLHPPKSPLSDGVVLVRPPDERDSGALADAASVADIVHYFGTSPDPGSEVQFFQERWAEGIAGAFAIWAEDQSLGVVLLEPRSQGYADIGFWLLPHARGMGYASRATRLVAEWALADLGLPRVQLWASPENRASQRVAVNSGFQYEGRLRNHGVEPSGKRVDALFYSLVPEDLNR